jgi:hypothetical protein
VQQNLEQANIEYVSLVGIKGILDACQPVEVIAIAAGVRQRGGRPMRSA